MCVQEVEVTAENDPAGLNVLSLSQEPLRQQHSEQSSFRLDVKGAMTCAELYDRASAFGSLVALTGWNQLVYADREAAKKARASLDGLKLDEDDVLRVNWASSQPSSPPQRSPRQAQGSGPAKERKKQGERHRSKKQNEDAQSPKQGGASERKETQGDKIGDKAEEGKSPSSRRAVAPHLLQPKRSVFGAAIQAIHQDQPVASPSREEVVAAQPVATEVTPNEDTPETWTVVSPPPSSPPLQEVVAAKKPSADDDAVPTVSAEDAAVSTPASPPVSPPQQTDHERLVSAVRTLPSSLVATERLPALISLLEALPRRDVKLCLLNSAVLEQKVHDALDVLDAMDEEDAQEPVEDVEAAEAAEAVVADDKVPAKLDTLPEDVNELANVSALEIVQLLEKAATSTPSAYCCGAAGSPVTAKAIQETDAFVDDLERSGVSAMIRKQRVGDRVHRVVKSFGLKPAVRPSYARDDAVLIRGAAEDYHQLARHGGRPLAR